MLFRPSAKLTVPRVNSSFCVGRRHMSPTRRSCLSTDGTIAMQTNRQTASNSKKRLRWLCLPEADSPILREHSTSSRNSQQSAKQMFKRGHLTAIFTGIAVFIFSKYYFKKSIKDKRQATGHRASDNIDTDTYIDPHRKGEGKLRRFKADTPCWLPGEFVTEKKLEQVTQFPVDDTDIFAVSFPKSGTTWLQEIIFLLHTELDFKKATDTGIDDRFPYFEFIYPGIETIARSTPPRLIKSHLQYDFMPDGVKQGHGKVVYIARNPRDVCVSFYHFVCMLTGIDYQGSFTDFFKTFVSGKVPYGPWSEHVIGYWKHRDDSNILFITYEELQKNPVTVVKRIATFLGKDFDQSQLEKVVDHCSFKKMKKNPSANWMEDNGLAKKHRKTDFFRKGEVGDWVNHFDVKMCEDMDKACADRTKAEGLEFVYKL